jgi:hypothetical protein
MRPAARPVSPLSSRCQRFHRLPAVAAIQCGLAEQVEWDSRRETLVPFGDGVEPLVLGRVAAMRLREILGGTA